MLPSVCGEGCGRGCLHPHWGPRRAQGLLSLQAASLCLSHPQIPHIPVGMTAGLGEKLWNSTRVVLLVYFWSHIITTRGKKEILVLEGELQGFSSQL